MTDCQKQPKRGKPIHKILYEHPDFPEIGPERPYCMFDSVVLSALVYLPILNVPQFGSSEEAKPVTVKDVCTCTLNACLFGDTKHTPCEGEMHNYKRYRKMFKANNEEKEVIKRVKLLLAMRECKRYRDLIVSDFLADYNKAYKSSFATQFAAVTFWAPKADLRIVVLRGTDGTRAGWKEDCMLASTTIMSCGIALKYIQGIASKYTEGKLAIVGHSKGGNLALYGALKDDKVVERIVTKPEGVGVINLDGPGLKICDEIDTSRFAPEVHKAVTTYITQTSIIGVTIKGEVKAGEYQCVLSKEEFVMQHCIFTWLFDDDANPVKEEQDDVSRYFESVFKDIRVMNDPEKLTEMVFSILPGDENDDFMGSEGGMSTETVLSYCINFLSLDVSHIKNLGVLFSDIFMARLRKMLVPAARNKYYDYVIIASALVSNLAQASINKETNSRIVLVLDGIRRGAQKNLSFSDAAKYIADESFKVVAENLQKLCASLTADLEESKALFSNTRKNSPYEVITRAISFMKGIISTAIHTRMVVRTARKFGYLKGSSDEYGYKAARESARDMPPADVLAEAVRSSADLFKRTLEKYPPVPEAINKVSDGEGGEVVLSARTDFGSDSTPKSDLIIDLKTPRKVLYGLSILFLSADDPVEFREIVPPNFREVPPPVTEMFQVFQGRQERGTLEMKGFGVYLVRAYPTDKATKKVPPGAEPLCQVCVHYLPRVEITAVIAGRDIEVDYAPDLQTKALMRFDALKKASWWVGVFRKDGSIVSCAACGDFDDAGKALIDLPQDKGRYTLRFYTSFHAGCYSETPLKIGWRHITSLKASRVFIPDIVPSAAVNSSGAVVTTAPIEWDRTDRVEICVRWSSWSTLRKMYDWIGLFGAKSDGGEEEAETLICARNLVDSEDYTVFSGRLHFVLTQEEAASLRAIRLYSNGNKDVRECGCMIEELGVADVEDEEAVYLQRDKAKLAAQPETDAFRWTKAAPDRSAMFVVSRSFYAAGAVHIMADRERYLGIKSDGTVSCTAKKAEDECFDVIPILSTPATAAAGITPVPGAVGFRSHFCSNRYLAVDSRGRLKVSQTLDKDAVFVCSKVRKEGRYTLSAAENLELCLSAGSGKSPSFGKRDRKNEMLEIFDLCNGRVLIRLANGEYLSASEKGTLSYSETRGPKEVFTVSMIEAEKKKWRRKGGFIGDVRIKSSFGQYLFYSKKDGLFTSKNDHPGKEANFRLEKQIAYIQKDE